MLHLFPHVFNKRRHILPTSPAARPHLGYLTKMEFKLLLWAFSLLMPHCCRCASVSQTPSELTVGRGESATLTCQQKDTEHITMLWYRQHHGQGPQLLVTDVSGSKPTFQEEFERRFEVVRADIQRSTLKIQTAGPGDRAMYYCAATEGAQCFKPLPHYDNNHSGSLLQLSSSVHLRAVSGSDFVWLPLRVYISQEEDIRPIVSALALRKSNGFHWESNKHSLLQLHNAATGRRYGSTVFRATTGFGAADQ
ncbi:uncharacterized protein [Heterodontus francisci]|uniref:uncharacterized protein n=1 Tax=Heterodontus francisci TaxID=7792 RepID=UPI00355BAA81